MVTAFGKEIGYSLVTFRFGHQIVKNDKVPFIRTDKLRAMETIWDAMHKFYARNSLLEVLVQGLPLSKHHKICSQGGCMNGESNSFLVHSFFPD